MSDPTNEPDDLPPDQAVPDQAGPNRRLVAALLAIGVIAVIGASVWLIGGDDPDTTGINAACQPSGAQPLAEGLQPEPGPDALPAGVLCEFNSDEGFDVASLLGDEPLVLNFFASWCAPCVAEMPDFEQLHAAADGQVRLIGINTQDSPPLAEELLAETGITYDVVSDPTGDYFAAVGGFGMPTTLLVAPDGTIAYRQTGPLTLEQMDQLVAEHLDVDLDL